MEANPQIDVNVAAIMIYHLGWRRDSVASFHQSCRTEHLQMVKAFLATLQCCGDGSLCRDKAAWLLLERPGPDIIYDM